jgi:gliding motility-associated-like protein
VGGAWTPVLAGAGVYTYTVTATAPCAVNATATVTVTAQAAPNAGTNGTLTICAGSTVTAPQLFAQLGGTPDVGGAWTPVLAGAGVYTYTVTATAPCAVNATATVTVTAQAAVVASGTQVNVLCNGASTGSIDLSVTGGSGSYTYLWSNGATTQDISGLSAGLYTVAVTESNGCSVGGTLSYTITEPAAVPTPVISAGGPTTFCSGGSVTLTAPASTSYLWSTAETTQSITVSSSGSYTVSVTDANGCTSAASAPVVVTVNALPATPTIAPGGPTTFCAGGSVTLTAPISASYLWSTTETTQSITVSSSGSYTVRVTDGAGCTSAVSAATVVTVNATPVIAHGTDVNPTTCGGTDGSIGITGLANITHYTVAYKKNGSLVHIADVVTNASGVLTIGGLGAGSYTIVSVTTSNNCTSNTLPGPYVLNDPPVPTIATSGGIAAVCYSSGSQTTTLAYTATTNNPTSYNINWDTTANTAGLMDQNNTTFSFNSGGGSLTGIEISASTPAGIYNGTLTIVNDKGCSNSLAVSVTVNPLPATPVISIGGPTTFCSGGSVTLTTPASTSYLWSSAETTQSITVSSSGSYTVSVTDANGCTSAASAPVVVTVNALPATPTITPGGPKTFCAGGSVTLTAPASTSYLWSTAATTQSITVSSSGSYTVSVTDANGCTSAASAPVVVTVNALPATPTITPGGPTTFCAGGSVTLTAPLSASYLWSTTETTQSITVSSSGSYTVRVTDGAGCTSAVSAATVVTVNPLPAVTFTVQPGATACYGANVTYTTQAGQSNYVWGVPGVLNTDYSISAGGISATDHTVTLKWLTIGNKTVTINYTNANGCTAASPTSSITTTVSVCNAPPVITSNGGGAMAAVNVAENTTAVTTVTATDPDAGQILTFSITGGVDSGLFSINSSTGVLTFITAPNYESPTDAGGNNVYDVQVTVTDNGTGNLTDVQDIAVTVTNVNEPPMVSDINKTINEDTQLTFTAADFTGKFTDVDGNSLTKVKITSLPANGTLKLSGVAVIAGDEILTANLGNLTFDPAANWNGSTSFGWNGYDGTVYASANATVNITVTAVNDAPVAVNDAVTTNEDTPVTINVTTNDTDVDGTINVSTVDLDPTTAGIQTTWSVAGEGSYNVDALGVVTFTPALNYNGAATVNYTVQDNSGATSNVATLTVTVTAVNDAPVVSDINKTINEDTQLTFATADFTGKFADVDGNSMTKVKITSLPANGTLKLSGVAVIAGDEILTANLANLTFSPTMNWNGSTTFGWNGNDGIVYAAANATAFITVAPSNSVPLAVGDLITTDEDTPIIMASVAGNDISSADGGNIWSLVGVNGGATHGKVIMSVTGTYSYTPDANFNGSDRFIYKLCDADGDCSSAAVTITIKSVNDLPLAVDDVATTLEDITIVNGTVTLNDIESGDGGNIWSLVGVNGGAKHGLVTMKADGTFTYQPDANYNGTDVFNYKLCDVDGDCSEAKVTVIITPVNDLPLAVNDNVTTLEDTPVVGATVSVNDIPSGDGGNTWSLEGVNGGAAHGNVTMDNSGRYTYTPNANFNGIDVFTYKLCDVDGDCSTAKVTVIITPVNDLPVAVNDIITTNEDTPITGGSVAANDIPSGDGGNLWYLVGANGGALHGTIAMNGFGTYTYTPNANYWGSDGFTYKLCDVDGDCSTAYVSITILPVNDTPVAAAQQITTLEDVPFNGVIIATDVELDVLTFSKASDPMHGTVTVNANGTYTYTPAADYNGTDSFTITVSDGKGGNTTVPVNVTITPVNDAPSFEKGGNQSLCENSGRQIINNWATSLRSGPANESAQSLLFIVSNDNNSIFSEQPIVSSNGDLYYTPAFNQSGTATISVQLRDDGGTSNGGVNSSVIQMFTITIHSLPEAPVANDQQSFCGMATIADLSATVPAGFMLKWYSSSVGGSALAGTTPIATATTYYVAAVNTISGCTSTTRKAVSVTINEIPATPAGSQSQTFCTNIKPTLSDIAVTGLNVKWYNALSAENELPGRTLLIDGTTYYASQTINGCESAIRLAVKATVQSCNTNHVPVVDDFSKTSKQNQTVSFSASDFASKFADADNEILLKILIVSLPANGKLLLAGQPVSIDQEILITDLNKLEFVPDNNYTGETSFRWNGSDGKNYAVSDAYVYITITPSEIFIPEGFSPNGDGVNDFFVIGGADKYTITLRVFNRWGNKVFESERYKNDWNGNANIGLMLTKELPGGTYYYTVNLNNGEKEIIGYLTLIR